MKRRPSDWGGNIAALILVLVVNTLSGTIPLNGQTMPEISAKYPSLFTPAGFTFSIWGLIYLALIGFAIYQALPAQRANGRIASIGGLFRLNCVANALWIFAWHYDLLLLSLALMLAILASLVWIYRSLGILDPRRARADRCWVQFPFGLYTGWITVATIANLSAVQIHYGLDALWISPIDWTLLKLALAGAIAAGVMLRRGDAVFGLVVAWAAYGISVKQAATPEVSGAAVALALLASMLALASLAGSLRASRGAATQ